MAYIPNSGKGTADASLEFCTAQAIPDDGADDISENLVDLIDAAPDLRGTNLNLKVQITTLVEVESGESSTMNFNIVTGSTAALCTVAATEIAKAVLTLGHDNAKGKVYIGAIPQKPVTAYERFIGLVLEPVSDDTLYSAGAVDAWLEPGQ